MRRSLLSLILLGSMAALAHAHMVYVVPQKGDKVQVVFADGLEPDGSVPIEKAAQTKLSVVGADGKPQEVKAVKGDVNALEATVPGTGDRVVFGTCEYGVMAKGDSKPFKLVYHPKAILGDAFAKTARVGEASALEIVPVRSADKTRLLVLAKGKPAAKSEVSVETPEGKKEKFTTDDEGLTPAFAGAGRVSAFAKLTESAAGELAGKKFEEVRHYATLVADLAAAK